MKKQLKPERMLLVMALVVSMTNTLAQAPTYAWAISEGGIDDDVAYSLATDAAGNILVAGSYGGTVDFNPGAGTQYFTATSRDFFVQKLSKTGQLLWVHSFGSGVHCEAYGVDVDNLGNVYVTGVFEGTVDFDPGAGTYNLSSFNPTSDVFVLKLNSSGNFVWAKRFGGPNSETARSISCGTTGVHIIGNFYGTVNFDPGGGGDSQGTTSGVGGHTFVQKLDLNGNYLWTRTLLATHSVVGLNVHVDASDNVLSCGAFTYCTVDFNPGVGVYNLVAPNVDGYIQKLDANGNFLWARAMNGTATVGDVVMNVRSDASGNVITTGLFYGPCDFDYGAGVYNVSPSGGSDVFIHKMDPSGNFTWVKTFGSASSSTEAEIATSTVLDNTGNIYNVGYFDGTVDFDPGSGVTNLISPGGTDAFIQKLDMNGNFLWARNYGGPNGEWAWSVDLDPDLSIVTCGGFLATTDFDPDAPVRNLTSNGLTDIYVQKIGQCTGSLTASITETINPSWPYNTSSLNAVVSGSSGPFTYRWKRGSSTVSTTSQVLNPCSGATYVLTVTDQVTGCVATASYYFNNPYNAFCNNPGGPGGLGLEEEQTVQADWIVFPNPSSGKFNLALDQTYARVAVKLTMLSGQQIYTDTQSGAEHISFDLDLPAGVYILDVQADELQHKFKLTIE